MSLTEIPVRVACSPEPNLTQGLFHCTLLRSPLPFPEHVLQLHLSLTRDRLPNKDSNVAFYPLRRRQTRGRSARADHIKTTPRKRGTQMARYQFFSIPASNRQQYTYVDMASPSFLAEKAELLAQGFEVQEDFIDATNPQEAVEKYKSDFLYVADEVGKSDSSYAAASALMEMGKKLFGRKTNG